MITERRGLCLGTMLHESRLIVTIIVKKTFSKKNVSTHVRTASQSWLPADPCRSLALVGASGHLGGRQFRGRFRPESLCILLPNTLRASHPLHHCQTKGRFSKRWGSAASGKQTRTGPRCLGLRAKSQVPRAAQNISNRHIGVSSKVKEMRRSSAGRLLENDKLTLGLWVSNGQYGTSPALGVN